jgi:hypothetical protein
LKHKTKNEEEGKAKKEGMMKKSKIEYESDIVEYIKYNISLTFLKRNIEVGSKNTDFPKTIFWLIHIGYENTSRL